MMHLAFSAATAGRDALKRPVPGRQLDFAEELAVLVGLVSDRQGRRRMRDGDVDDVVENGAPVGGEEVEASRTDSGS
jgi:hypothetical protein